MNTNKKRLLYGLAAPAAFLCSALWINADNLSASFFRFAAQECDEVVPSSITNTTSQPVVPEHPLDIQAFNSDGVVSVDQSSSDLVVHVHSGISHLSVQGRDTLLDLFPGGTALLTARQGTLAATKILEVAFQGTAVSEGVTFGSGGECLEPDINAYRSRTTRGIRFRHFDAEANEPLAVLADDSGLFDSGVFRKFAVPADADCANALEPEFSINNLASISHAKRE